LVCAAGNSTQPRLGFFKHELMLVRLEVVLFHNLTLLF